MKKSNLITVSAAVLLLSVQSAAAQVCTTPPTCDALGYTKTASECGSNPMLKCPLDQSKVFCHTPQTEQAPTTEPPYTCTYGGYLRITDFSKIINNCNSYPAKINSQGASFFCEASGTNISVGGLTVAGGLTSENQEACNSAYRLAQQTGIAGCCNYSGKLILAFPPISHKGDEIIWK